MIRSSKVTLYTLLVLLLAVGLGGNGEAASKKKRRAARKYYPPLTHPVVLWARTLSKSEDLAERKKAAFKLSAYTQPIYHSEVIASLLTCSKDEDVEIKVLCTKALGKAGNRRDEENIRKELVKRYKSDKEIRETIVRTFVARKDSSPEVQDILLDSAENSTNEEELLNLLTYFEHHGSGTDKFVSALSDIYKKHDDSKIQRAVIKALSERAKGQDAAVGLFAQCAESGDTPLVLTCLSGLQRQATKDKRAWAAVTKTIESSDPDVLDATLDVINAMPETANPELAARLIALIDDSEDPQMLEKAILALGVCGDHTEPVVIAIQKVLEQKETEDATRVAAALVLGKQSDKFPEKTREALAACMAKGSQNLKTACDLGMKELESRKLASKKK